MVSRESKKKKTQKLMCVCVLGIERGCGSRSSVTTHVHFAAIVTFPATRERRHMDTYRDERSQSGRKTVPQGRHVELDGEYIQSLDIFYG